jgi:ATP-dependent RNA circularization protein (DNA/RNA ligase family)
MSDNKTKQESTKMKNKTENQLSDNVEIILETTLLRVVRVIKGWDKGTLLLQNQNQLLNGWGEITRVGVKDAEILINNLSSEESK